MKKLPNGVLPLILIFLFAGCSLKPSKEQLEQMKLDAPKSEITPTEPLKIYSAENEDILIMVLRAGTYSPIRKFAGGYIYMLPNIRVDIPADTWFSKEGELSERVGGIYWRRDEHKPKAVCFYESEFIPTIRKTNDLNFLVSER